MEKWEGVSLEERQGEMIKTMAEFRTILKLVTETGNPFEIVDLIQVIDLRLRRIENYLGIIMPRDLLRVREIEGRNKLND